MRCKFKVSPFILTSTLALLVIIPIVLVAAARETTIVPLGGDQSQIRPAYQALFQHISDGGRVHWAQHPFNDRDSVYGDDSQSHPAGTLVAPDGLNTNGYDSLVVSGTITSRPSLALDATGTRIAVFRSTVSDPTYGNAAWELADIRETFDSYLWGALRYDILDEHAITTTHLSQYAMILLPTVRQGNEHQVVEALGPSGLAKLKQFVTTGGFLYAQSNGAVIAEAAGIIPAGTVDLSQTLTLAPSEPHNMGHITRRDPTSPLAFSWLTSTLYLLDDPLYHPTDGLTTIAEFDRLDGPDQPAIMTGQVGLGRVILVDGHPTTAMHRDQLPVFFNAILWALGHPAELFGHAIQVYNPDLDPHLLPAYEPGTPVSTTLTFANVWDTPMHNVIVTTTVASGFNVLPESLSPAGIVEDGGVYGLPAGQSTLVIWYLGDVAPGEVDLSFVAQTDDQVLSRGEITFATSQATFTHDERPHTIRHQPFTLNSRMAARLLGDRDIESDRQFFIPQEGIDLDVTLSLANKEDTLASSVVMTDVILCLAPIVSINDQETILDRNTGQTIWIKNEPYFYDEKGTPYVPPDGYEPGQTIPITSCDGPPATFTVPFGIHGEVEEPGLQGTGNYITIPATYTTMITLTADHQLLLPTKVLTWTLGDWAGYHHDVPAIRYGIHSSELFSRTVTFEGDPGDTSQGDVIIRAEDGLVGGSVYTHLGDHPIFYRDHLASGVVAVPQSPISPTISYQDIWSRPHTHTLRAAFYDIFSWASCQCGPGMMDQHAGLNVTFGMQADKNRDTVRNEPVVLYPGRLDRTDVTILIKSRNMGQAVQSNEMVIDMGMFKGLGVQIVPRSGSWETSWQASNPDTHLVDIQRTAGYDHLYFQYGMGAQEAEEITLEATIISYPGRVAEGMVKLHDGARLTYRQQAAGPSRYEVYDTHVQGVIGAATEITVRKQGTPILVSTFGDTIYYVITLDDRADPRTLRRNGTGDPFLQSYGFGDTTATTYLGGRDQKTILHSIVQPGEWTRLRVEVNNNSGRDFTNVQITPQPPAGIHITPSYQDRIPPAVYYDLPYLALQTIPDAGHAIYYFDVRVEQNYAGQQGRMVEIPIAISGAGLPPELQIPSAQLGIANSNGTVAYVSSPANQLTLTDNLPPDTSLVRAVEATATDVQALTHASDTEQRARIFAGLTQKIAFKQDAAGGVQFDLPSDILSRLYNLDGDHRIFLIAQAVITPTQAGPMLANYGAQASYGDDFGMQWQTNSSPLLVEVHGAAVRVTYACTGITTDTHRTETPISGMPCILEPGNDNQVHLKATMFNAGDYPALGVTTRLVVPPGVTILNTSPGGQIHGSVAQWEMGDIAPGAAKRAVSLTVAVPMTQTDETVHLQDWAMLADDEQTHQMVQIITHSEGQFFEPFSNKLIDGLLGGALHIPARGSDQSQPQPTRTPTSEASKTPIASPTPTNQSTEEAGNGTPTMTPEQATITPTGQPSEPTRRPPLSPTSVQTTHTPAPSETPLTTSPEPTRTPEPTVTPTSGTPNETTTPTPILSPTPSPALSQAVLRLSYTCTGVSSGSHPTVTDDIATCILESGEHNRVTMKIVVTNVGGAVARDITLQQMIVPGVTVVTASPKPQTIHDSLLTWQGSDLEPGAMLVINLTLDVPVNLEGGVGYGTQSSSVEIIHFSESAYTDTLSGQHKHERIAGAYYLPVSPPNGVDVQLSYACVTTTEHSPSAPPSDCLIRTDSENTPVIDITVTNKGTDAAEQVHVYLVIPQSIQVTEMPPSASIAEQTVNWTIGILNPGERATLRLHTRFSVTSLDGIEVEADQQSVEIITRSYATYTDTRSQRYINVSLGGAYVLPIAPQKTSVIGNIYLPLVMRNSTAATQDHPDLVITRFEVSPANPTAKQPATITVEVHNRGGATTSSFWVDVYINPTTIPTQAGIRWDNVCGVSPCQGIAWKVEGLDDDERITLTSTADSYVPQQTIWDGTFAVGGTHNLYVYVDSWNGNDPSGHVYEADETNNRADLLGLPIAGDAMLTALPPRPDLPPREMERGR